MQEQSPLTTDLCNELKLLASDPGEQRVYLEDLGTWDCLDELALELDRSYYALRAIGGLTDGQVAALEALNTLLSEMSHRSSDLWHGEDALRRPEWGEVRKLANEALASVYLDP